MNECLITRLCGDEWFSWKTDMMLSNTSDTSNTHKKKIRKRA